MNGFGKINGNLARYIRRGCRDRRPPLSVNTNKICSANLRDITNNPYDFDQIFHFYADSRGRLSLQIVPTFVRKHPINIHLSLQKSAISLSAHQAANISHRIKKRQVAAL